MRILVAPNAFKGSLTAGEACLAIEEGIRKVLPRAEIIRLPMADGGDGTLEALLEAVGGEMRGKTVTGPLGKPVEAGYGLLADGRTAVVEMASASGLALVPAGETSPLEATTFGTGELIKDALGAGRGRLIIGIGGSATNDGGAGMAQALGARFLDSRGEELGRGGGALLNLRSIDLSGMARPAPGTEVIIASDVTNPLCGPEGASHIYGPQKGASPDEVKLLEESLSHYSDVIKEQLGKDLKDVPGSGAAGGLGAGLMAFLGARVESGVKIVMEVSGFAEKAGGADIVITGEGRIDGQTAYGKAPGEIALYCKDKKIPVIGFCGMLEDDADGLYGRGFNSFFSILKKPCTLEYAVKHSYALLEDAARRLAGILAIR